jgi:hypothetical protein
MLSRHKQLYSLFTSLHCHSRFFAAREKYTPLIRGNVAGSSVLRDDLKRQLGGVATGGGSGAGGGSGNLPSYQYGRRRQCAKRRTFPTKKDEHWGVD